MEASAYHIMKLRCASKSLMRSNAAITVTEYMPCCSVLQLDGRRAPVIDLLATSTQPNNNNNMSTETIYILSTEPEVEGGISGSPPAILDNWLQLQHAFSLESVNNGNTTLDDFNFRLAVSLSVFAEQFR